MEQNLNLYRIFTAVAESGSVSRAADALYLSQPAVSRAVQKLEEALDTPLFTRSSRGVSLTNAGAALHERLRAAFAEIEAGERELRLAKELGVGSLTIGASSTLCKYLLLPFLKGFVEQNPHVRITIESQSTSHTLRLLEERKLDLALVVRPASARQLRFLHVADIHDIFVATDTYLGNLRERAPAPSGEEAERALFQNANLMLLDDRNVSRLHIDAYFEEAGITPGQILVANNMDLLIDFARIGLGVAGVIREFVADDLHAGRLVEIPLTRPVKKRVAGFAHRKDATLSPAAEEFLTYCQGALPL